MEKNKFEIVLQTISKVACTGFPTAAKLALALWSLDVATRFIAFVI